MKLSKPLRESVGASSILGKGNELLRGYSLQLKERGLPPRRYWGDRMSQFTSCLCFCGAAESLEARRSSTLERACLEARLRVQMGSGPQALVLYFNVPTPKHPPLFLIGQFTVAALTVCNNRCLDARDLLFILSHGFSRVLLQLSPDIRLIRHQMDLVEAIARCPGQDGKAALFHSDSALWTLLECGEEAPLRDAAPSLASLEGEQPQAEGCVTITAGCTLCGQCGWACPTGAIHLGESGSTLEINDSLCSGCGMCASACPEQVLAIQALAPLRKRA